MDYTTMVSPFGFRFQIPGVKSFHGGTARRDGGRMPDKTLALPKGRARATERTASSIFFATVIASP